MASRLFVLGTSHAVASAGVRERMHVDLDEAYAALERIMEMPGLVDEAVPLSTCGRFEVYAVTTRPARLLRVLKRLLAGRTGMDAAELARHSFVHRGEDAARHLFRVAAGLDSVIYGEAQILGQVRGAMAHPRSEGTAGILLRRLFQSAVTAGRRVRSETAIGRGSASVAGAALCLLEAEMGPLHDRKAVVLGAGRTGALMARLLHKAGVGRLSIVNRTRSTAETVAAELGAEAHGLDAVAALVRDADVVVGTVAGRQDLVTPDVLDGDAGVKRRHLLDLAHPRNFDPHLAHVPGVRLVDLDHVFGAVEEARRARTTEVPRAEAIVDAEVENFLMWIRARHSAPVLRAVREQVLALAQQEAERQARGLPPEQKEELARFARSLARTILHGPTVALREADASTSEGRWLLRAAPSLFGVDIPWDEAEHRG